MAEIRWTQEAVSWLEDIFSYISKDDPEAASNVVNGIYEKTQVLSEFPQIGYVYRNEPEGGSQDPSVWPLSDNIPCQR